jgi:hypothetical protein
LVRCDGLSAPGSEATPVRSCYARRPY